jgi:hypothetical protein
MDNPKPKGNEMFNQPSPREIYLEHEVGRLKTENQYLRDLTRNEIKHTTLVEPEEMYVPQLPKTVQLPMMASCTIRPEAVHGYHILVQEHQRPSCFSLGYYASGFQLERVRDRASLLQHLNTKALTALAEMTR